MAEQAFCTVMEAAEYLRVSRQTIYRLLHEGKLRSVRIGLRRTLIPVDAIRELVAQDDEYREAGGD